MRLSCVLAAAAAVSVLGGAVRAQEAGPAPAPSPIPTPEEARSSPPGEEIDPADAAPAADDPGTSPVPLPGESAARAKPASPEPASLPPVQRSNIFYSPTGHILPAAVVQAGLSVDTGGSPVGEVAIGLGDVAEFGLTVTDLLRARHEDDGEPDGLFPYALAHFKMGVAEDRMFRHQPAVALGFRKSFERDTDEHRSRVAELYLALSKELSSALTVHAGASFWDASLENLDGDEVTLHGMSGGSAKNQLRPFGGVELRPLVRAQIMAEVFWVPELVYRAGAPEDIRLRPELAWGVGYDLSDWGQVQAGVRVPDIGEVNLLDAQIFGQFKITTTRLRSALGR